MRWRWRRHLCVVGLVDDDDMNQMSAVALRADARVSARIGP